MEQNGGTYGIPLAGEAQDPYVNRPVSASIWRLLLGILIVDVATFAGSFIGSNSESTFLNGSWVACLVALLFVRFVIFGSAHPLDQSRWKSFWNGDLLGYWISYFLLMILYIVALNDISMSPLFQEVALVMIYVGASIFGMVIGLVNVYRSESKNRLEFISTLGDARAVLPFISVLREGNRKARAKAAAELGKLGDRRAIDPLIQALQDKDATIRANAAASLGQLGDARAVYPLVNAFNDMNEAVRANAAIAIGKIGDTRAVPQIVNLLYSGQELSQSYAAQALGHLRDPRAVDPLINLYRSSNSWTVRNWTILALGKIGDPRAEQTILAAQQDKNQSVRKSAASAWQELQTNRISVVSETKAASLVPSGWGQAIPADASIGQPQPQPYAQPLPLPVQPVVAPKKSRLNPSLIIALVLFSLMCLCGVSIWAITSLGDFSSNQALTGATTATSTPVASLQGFSWYQGDGMSIMLPNGFVGSNTTTNMDTLIQYLNGYGSTYSETVNLFSNNRDAFKFIVADINISTDYLIKTMVYTEEPAWGTTLDTYVQGTAQQLTDSCSECVVSDQENLTINGFTSARFYVSDPRVYSTSSSYYIVQDGGTFWTIIFTVETSNFVTYQPLFDQGVQTFTIEG